MQKREVLFDPEGLLNKLDEMNFLAEQPEFWSDQDRAQKLLREKKTIEKKLAGYDSLRDGIEDIHLMIELAESEEDEEMADEVIEKFSRLDEDIESLRLELLLSGKYDSTDAFVTIHAGTGGVDAMDWASMLLRMYLRWCDKKGYRTSMIDLQDDTEAGIKSATISVKGENAYGYLKNENGVHRLVRISPFNAQGKRQTSFASVEVMPEIEDDINIVIADEDIKVDTYRSSGAGGQHVNTTDSAVRITHIPTNIVVTCQNERSQIQNRETAMKILKGKLIELAEKEHQENLKELKGDFGQITWGNQIRSYVFQPYTMVKDHRTGAEVSNVDGVMDGDIDYFINEKLKASDSPEE